MLKAPLPAASEPRGRWEIPISCIHCRAVKGRQPSSDVLPVQQTHHQPTLYTPVHMNSTVSLWAPTLGWLWTQTRRARPPHASGLVSPFPTRTCGPTDNRTRAEGLGLRQPVSSCCCPGCRAEEAARSGLTKQDVPSLRQPVSQRRLNKDYLQIHRTRCDAVAARDYGALIHLDVRVRTLR